MGRLLLESSLIREWSRQCICLDMDTIDDGSSKEVLKTGLQIHNRLLTQLTPDILEIALRGFKKEMHVIDVYLI